MAEGIFPGDTPVQTVAEAVREKGFAIVRDALTQDQLTAMREDLAPYLDEAHSGHDAFMGSKTKRFGALIGKSKAVRALLCHPTVLAVADAVLLPHCVRYHVHYTGVMHLEPGEKAQVLHRDTGLFPFANPCPPLTVATMWAISDFTEQNGATRFVPGSHLWDDERKPLAEEIRSAEMPAGSVLIYTGNTIHAGGANGANAPRSGVALHYGMGWLRQEENQYLALSPEEAREMPEEILNLMGYALGTNNLGFVDHIHPLDYLRGVRDQAQSDLSSPEMEARAEQLDRLHVAGTKKVPSRFYDPAGA